MLLLITLNHMVWKRIGDFEFRTMDLKLDIDQDTVT